MPSPLPRQVQWSLFARLSPLPAAFPVGSCNCFFGACSAFTHVMACTLAESPSAPFHRKLRQLCCLRCRFDCYRVERTSSRAGVAPAEVQRLFTAHFFANKRTSLTPVALSWDSRTCREVTYGKVWDSQEGQQIRVIVASLRDSCHVCIVAHSAFAVSLLVP